MSHKVKARNNGGSAVGIESRGEIAFDIVVAIIGVLLILVCVYPIYYVVIASISRPLYVENGEVMFRPIMATLESYKEALKTPYLWASFGNSLFYTLFGVLVNMAFSTTMAYALSRPRLIFRKFFTLVAVFTMWFSAGIIPMYMNFRVPRQLKVHHQLKRFNIQTTRSNISRNQYTGATVSKTYQGLIAIALFQIAV